MHRSSPLYSLLVALLTGIVAFAMRPADAQAAACPPGDADTEGDGIPDDLDAVFEPAPSVPGLGSMARILAMAVSMALGFGLSLRWKGEGSR
jgi:hypothetical protein